MTKNCSLQNVNSFLDSEIESRFKKHPFSKIPITNNYQIIMENYFAMSQAFAYLQAGSQKDQFELTTTVGNFLCWDETRGLYPAIAMQLKALPRIFEIWRFHSNRLKQDCRTLFGNEIKADYSQSTSSYLNQFYKQLASSCPITRVSAILSFETHANAMIRSLWDSVSDAFPYVDKSNLTYFHMQISGDKPAEKSHMETTNNLINRIISELQSSLFIEKFLENYALHYIWCQNIVDISREDSEITQKGNTVSH